MSGLWATPWAERQERVRSAPRLGPMSAFVPVHRHATRPHTGPVSGRNNYSDMSAVYGRNPPQRRHNSTRLCCRRCSGQTDRNESGFRAVQARCPRSFLSSCPPRRIPHRIRPAPTSQTCLPYVCRNAPDAATTQTCPCCRRCSGQTDRSESGLRPVRARFQRSFLSIGTPPVGVPARPQDVTTTRTWPPSIA